MMSRRSFVNTALSVVLLALTASAQQLIPTTPSAAFPACGLSCGNLLSAQAACVPPTVPTFVQQQAVACFCSQPSIANWQYTPNGVCDQYCPEPADRVSLQNWYAAFCASGGTNNNGAAAQPSSSTGQGVATTLVVVTSTNGVPTIVQPSGAATTSARTTAGTSSGSSTGDDLNQQVTGSW